MGIDYGYFTATDDDTAATALDLLLGPAWLRAFTQTADAEPPARSGGLLGRLRRNRPTNDAFVVMAGPMPSAEAIAAEEAKPEAFDVFYTRLFDPMVQLGTLEAILTGRTFEEILDDHADDESVACTPDGTRFVAPVSVNLCEALTTTTPQQLDEALHAWLQTEEFDTFRDDDGDVESLAEELHELTDLIKRARDRGHRLYCWVDA